MRVGANFTSLSRRLSQHKSQMTVNSEALVEGLVPMAATNKDSKMQGFISNEGVTCDTCSFKLNQEMRGRRCKQ